MKKAVLDRQLGGEIADPIQRVAFLHANCDGIESLAYMKHFDPETITKLKNDLSDSSIIIDDIEVEQKLTVKAFKDQLKPLNEEKKLILLNIKQKAEMVTEKCFRFVDQEAKMTGYYNSEGDLVSSRQMTPDEMQKTIFSMNTGTNN